MNSLDRMLGLLDLFTERKPDWTVDEIVEAVGLSRATAYRYLTALKKAGLVTRGSTGSFVVGPRVLEMDRQIRLSDPFLAVGRRVMAEAVHRLGGNLLLCSYYGDRVLCIHQELIDQSIESSYARGRPMPFFRGATSKVILAHLPGYQVRNLMLNHGAEIAAAGLGNNWTEFRASLREIRRQGYWTTKAETDPGVVGVSAPVFRANKQIVGSLTVIFAAKRYSIKRLPIIANLVMEAANEITRGIEKKRSAALGKRAVMSTVVRVPGIGAVAR